jgi:hypothetical protein
MTTRADQVVDLTGQRPDSPGADVVRWTLDIYADNAEAAQARAELGDRIRQAAAQYTATHGRDDDAHGR